MYKNLKFSWAHILAFLALICIGYVTFVGLTYDLDEGFEKPAIFMLGIIVILTIWFIGAQQLKGIDNDYDFNKCIWWERILVFTSPIIFIICMLPFNHAMNVASESKKIEETFKSAIESSTKLFDDYDIYIKHRIENYELFLNRVKSNRNLQPTLYKEIGFNGVNDNKKIEIEVQTLKRQLKENYDSLNVVARDWIGRVNQRTSVWNVFLVGNIKEIENAINDWSSNLKSFSSVILTTEKLSGNEIYPFDADEVHLNSIISDLNSLSDIYNPEINVISMNFRTIIWGIILYLLLLFPYLIQERNGVSAYKLFGRRFRDIGIDMSHSFSSPNEKRKIKSVNVDINQRKESLNPIIVDMSNNRPSFDSYDCDENPNDEVNNDYLTKEERRIRRQEKRNARNNSNNE